MREREERGKKKISSDWLSGIFSLLLSLSIYPMLFLQCFSFYSLKSIPMVIEKTSSTEKKTTTKTIFGRLTNRFINQQRRSKRDQSVQTGLHSTVLIKSHFSQQNIDHTRTPLRRRRSSLKTFLTFQSPKPIFLIHRARRCSVNFKTPKRLSSECLVRIHFF